MKQQQAQSSEKQEILVTGGTGKTGRRLVAQLREAGHGVRVGSRSASPTFDWDEPATWGPALEGVSAVYLAFQPDLSAPHAAETAGAFARRAADLGVSRLALLSARREPSALRVEEAVSSAGVPSTTMLRAAWFHQNFSESLLLGAVLEGILALPVGDVAEPFIDASDIAAVAARVLTEEGHGGQAYELTGPRSLTFHEVAETLSAFAGRQIAYAPISADEFRQGLAAQGLEVADVELLTNIVLTTLDGRNAEGSSDVERLLGRPAIDLQTYAREAAASGVWRVP